MFIVDFAWGLVQLAALAGGGLYLYGDYKRSWTGTKCLLGGAHRLVLRLTGRQEDAAMRANKIVGEFAKELDGFRRAVAGIEADIQVSEKQVAEQGALSIQYAQLMEVALRKGDDRNAAVAAEASLQAQTRIKMLASHITELRQFTASMREELADQESNFDMLQTEATTVRVKASLAETKERLYVLVSDVHERSGLTPRAELKRLVTNTDKDDIQAGILLNMVKNNPHYRAQRLLRSAGAENVLEEARQKLALSAGKEDGEAEEAATLTVASQ